MIAGIVADLFVGTFALMFVIVLDLWRDTQMMHTIADIDRIEAAWSVADTVEYDGRIVDEPVDDGDASTCLTPCVARHCATHRAAPAPTVIAGELVDEPTVVLDAIAVTAPVELTTHADVSNDAYVVDAPAIAEAPLRRRPAVPETGLQRFRWANTVSARGVDFWAHRIAQGGSLLGMWVEPVKASEVFGPMETGELPIIGRPPILEPTRELALVGAGAELIHIGQRRAAA